MVEQGDIIKVNFNPQRGHEQAGYRPALIVSNNFFNQKTNLVIACPITNTNNKFPLHIPLDDRTETTGVILCEHVKTLDLNARGYKFVEKLPLDILSKVIEVLYAQVEEI
ncbi:type II toxin-antitoxin system PemK/MazF family toxin [Lagierella massiliensis]|uniref:type II toxin-antitoxin system PemK/MazF family toxin n=1 Tax=Lagierella massiliensis TaxID=1689303 RepID=UPI0006D862E1|nr:type II toxin-antitoxin system PemK/MazF family toxin [Lagierella massiliensis]